MTIANLDGPSTARVLSLQLGAEKRVVDFGRVLEILPFDGATWLPGFAPAVRGVVALRDEAVPAIELAVALGLRSPEPTPAAVTATERCLVIVEASHHGSAAAIGLVIDAVREILDLGPAERTDTRGEPGGTAGAPAVDLEDLLDANPMVRGPADRSSDRASRTAGEGSVAGLPAYLLFDIAGMSFALPLPAIGRVAPLVEVQPVPAAHPLLRGLVTLPDADIAVLDLAASFGLPLSTPSAHGHVVVTNRETFEAARPDRKIVAGLLVDGGRRVLEPATGELLAPPTAAGLFAARWIAGLIRTEGGLVPILDPDTLLDAPALRAAVAALANALAVPELASEPATSPEPTTEPAVRKRSHGIGGQRQRRKPP